jgi:hypothetical protein
VEGWRGQGRGGVMQAKHLAATMVVTSADDKVVTTALHSCLVMFMGMSVALAVSVWGVYEPWLP